MPSPRFSIAAPAAKAAVGYCHGRIRNVSRGILAMEKKIKEQRVVITDQGIEIVHLSRVQAEQASEIQMLREVNARLRKGWCVKEE